ncbi:oligosaccharide flippase family protein [Chryseobacterium sp. SSA4.19]|uniref:lipopolysaccharide biosynthesis protein n=1 Tax=Chryseobacterium sp. SSA4.19 TaxID=2919915 RepID=UPI001F4E6ABE|nr:oligosaccharide flippase family protein [Chryseobacterium sp. SSA4.19]MCJ8152377.1 oligosaccharide flippase family protein [Chryseobacterium sp. SSA4.19]
MNFSSKKLTINALSAVLQVVFTALLYFFLYKYLLAKIGVEQLGVWSLILSFSSIANLANLGLTSGLVKFVAEYLLEKDKTKLGKLIFTSTLSMSLLFGVLSLIILSFAQFFLGYVVEKKFLNIALEILPYSLGSLCINAVGGVFTSVLEGHQKNYIRNFIYIVSGIIMFGGTVLLTPIYQLKGVAIAQLIQSIFIFVTALLFTVKINQDNKIRYWKWSSESFKELFNYGYKFQLVSISQLLYEPATKLLLSRYGGLALLGHYEMATKAVNQFRALLTNANQVVIPVIAEKSKEGSSSFLQSFYVRMNRILLLITLPLSTVLILATPFISLIWLGSFNDDFMFSMFILIAMTFVNVMCGPSYFSALGEGRLNVLVIVHISMAIVNIILGLILGKLFGGHGIIIAWGIALSGGSLALILNYNKAINIRFSQMFRKQDLSLFIISAAIIGINTVVFQLLSSAGLGMKLIIIFLSLLLFLPVIIKNDNIRQLKSVIKKKESNV